jgi:hypothetical protein
MSLISYLQLFLKISILQSVKSNSSFRVEQANICRLAVNRYS